MTSRDQLEVLRIEDVRKAKVGDIIATLKNVERQHVLAMDIDEESSQGCRERGFFRESNRETTGGAGENRYGDGEDLCRA